MRNKHNENGLEPKEQYLFHYKEEPEHFYDALCNGIWPRYCEEDFTWLVGNPVIIAFPIVCFSDIPLKAAEEHRSTYGHFAISVSKRFASELDINPMWYLQQDTIITNHVASQMNKNSRFCLDEISQEFRPLLPYLKPTLDCQPARNTEKPTTEVKCFEEEMEWRYCPYKLSNGWIARDEKKFLTEEVHTCSQIYRLKLHSHQIDRIIVPTENDREFVKYKFPDLRNKVTTWDNV